MPVESTQTGELTLGGVGVSELAHAYGTPLFVIDTTVLDANVARFAQAAQRFDIDVAYAGKALLFVALAKRLVPTPLKLDVCSLGEIVTAERAGFPAERLVFHGCGKTDEELDAAAAARVGRVVIDHPDELIALGARVSAARPLDVCLRVNTGVVAQTHAYVRTGGEDSKFGFGLDAVESAIAQTQATPGLRLVGIHSHIGSQIFEAPAFAANLVAALDVYALALWAGAPMRDLLIGGGFGVDAIAERVGFDVPAVLGELRALLNHESALRSFAPPRLGIEPGRAIIATAGTSLYRVVTAKRQGARHFVIVDGGITDNPRPALYNAYHHPRLASRHSSAPEIETTICGRACENDQLVVAPMPCDLRAGDLLTFGTTGAYTFAMASNYNRFPRPAAVFAGSGRHRLVVRREDAADLLARDDAG
ncbi:MAG TPA: diaminopimelate decarboxylase [Candidatus Acidoferrales bacterium]|nr:diaminopimelate decarboxylase [Candidatus Acidoferrales bacterium]